MRVLRAAASAVIAGMLLTAGLAAPAAADTVTPPTGTPSVPPVPSAPAVTRPAAVTVTVPSPVRFGSATPVTVTATATNADGSVSPLPGAAVALTREFGDGRRVPMQDSVTDATGVAALLVTLPAGRHQLRASVTAGTDHAAAESAPVTLRVQRALARVRVTSTRVVSEQRGVLRARVSSPTAGAALAGRAVRVSTRLHGLRVWSAPTTMRLNAAGVVRIPVRVWRSTQYRVRFAGGSNIRAAEGLGVVWTRGPMSSAVQHGVKPRVPNPVGDAPVGSGPNVRIGPVPTSLWSSMAGTSWSAGCPVGRADLRWVQVNYWGFDGYRHRGGIVVRDRIAAAAGAVFADLYRQRFRIRSLHPEDRYGSNPLGPGADDYASMAADNSSGFNCRYVVGKERARVWSPHAYGIAIDVNPWENPYVAPTGVFPHRQYLTVRRGPGVLTAAAVRAFTSRGFFWGGRWAHADYQHFEHRG